LNATREKWKSLLSFAGKFAEKSEEEERRKNLPDGEGKKNWITFSDNDTSRRILLEERGTRKRKVQEEDKELKRKAERITIKRH